MADLSKFGVPLNGEKLGILHPKQKYRFRVILDGFGQGSQLREMTQNVATCSRPKYSQEKVVVDSYVSRAYIGGKHTWEPISLTLRDDITNAVVSAVGAQVQKQINHFEQTSAVAGINYKFTMEIHSLDGTTGEELESWHLDGCWIESVNWPEGDYSASDSQMVELTIQYDNATNLAGPNTNGGTTVGGNPFPSISSPTGGISIG